MKKSLCIGIIFFFLYSCGKKNGTIEKIDYQLEYKFSSEIEDKVAKDTVPWKYQTSAIDYASKGDYKNALKNWDLVTGTEEKNYDQTQIDSINSMYKKVIAKDFIIDRAKQEQVVIINEAHHNSYHRFFTKSLLKELFEIGYKNLGIEALGNGKNLDSLLMQRKYPIKKTGGYIIEPQFGNLVRDALEMGFKVFAYENTTNSNGIKRDLEQAKNIQEIIEKKSNEKFIIHCGFDHVLEGENTYSHIMQKTMAQFLKEITGINPLTINQVEYGETSIINKNHPLQKAINPTESTILLNNDNTPFKFIRKQAWTDIAVFHPNTKYEYNRPNWLFNNGNQKVEIELTDIELSFPVMVLAFKKGENINEAVPIDIYEATNSSGNHFLALKKGDYTVVITNGKESLKYNEKVK